MMNRQQKKRKVSICDDLSIQWRWIASSQWIALLLRYFSRDYWWHKWIVYMSYDTFNYNWILLSMLWGGSFEQQSYVGFRPCSRASSGGFMFGAMNFSKENSQLLFNEGQSRASSKRMTLSCFFRGRSIKKKASYRDPYTSRKQSLY